MDLPKKISSIDKKSSSTSRKMKKPSSTYIKAPLQSPKTEVTAGTSLKRAVDLYFQTLETHTPQISKSKMRPNNVIKKRSIPKAISKEKPEPPTRLQSCSSKSLRKSHCFIVPEKESIAEKNELVIDLASLMNKDLTICNSNVVNLPTPRSLRSFSKFIGSRNPEHNAETTQGNRDPRISAINSTDERINVEHNVTQVDPSLTPSKYSSIDSSSTLNQEQQDDVTRQLQANQLSEPSVQEDANNSLSTKYAMKTCKSSYTNGSNTTVARACDTPYVVPISQQQVNIFSSSFICFSCYFSFHSVFTKRFMYLKTQSNFVSCIYMFYLSLPGRIV